MSKKDINKTIEDYKKWEWIYAIAGAICFIFSFLNNDIFFAILGAMFLTWSCIAKFQKAACVQRYKLMSLIEEVRSNK